MTKSWTSSYRKRLVLLTVLGLLLTGLFLRKKILPTLSEWSTARSARTTAADLDMLLRERDELAARSSALELRLGKPSGTTDAWRMVLDLMAERTGGANTTLAGIAEEHLSEQAGLRIHTLPMSLEGRTVDLVKMIDEVERAGRGVFLLTVDLNAREIAYNKPRKLTATLYLQTLSP